MKFQLALLLGLATTLPFTNSLRAAESVQDAFRRGLLAEETTRDLKSAAEAYSEAVRLTLDQRAIEATALFRLAECQKKLGNSTEATATLQRLAREYPEQRELLAKIPANPESKRPFQVIDMAALPKLKSQLNASVSEYNEKVDEIANLNRRNEQLRQYSGVAFAARVPAEYSNPELPRLSAEINQATIRRTSLSPDFGPDHPEVRRQDLTLKELNQLMAEQKQAVLEKIDADLNQRSGQLNQLKKSAALLREEIDQEEAKIKAQADERKAVAVPSAGSSPNPSTASGNPGQTTTLSEADLRTQIDSLSAELGVLQQLPDALERGRFIVSRHPDLTTEQFYSTVRGLSALAKSSRTNASVQWLESQVQNYTRPIEDRLRFAKMELEVLQKQKADQEPFEVRVFGERSAAILFRPSEKPKLSDAIIRLENLKMVDLRKVRLHRRGANGGEDILTVDVDTMLKTGDRTGDIELRNGDQIELKGKEF